MNQSTLYFFCISYFSFVCSIVMFLCIHMFTLHAGRYHCRLSDSFPLQNLSTLLSIPTVFRSIITMMISIFTLISRSSKLFTRFSVTIPNTPATIGPIFFFFNFLQKFGYLSNFLCSFSFKLRYLVNINSKI